MNSLKWLLKRCLLFVGVLVLLSCKSVSTLENLVNEHYNAIGIENDTQINSYSSSGIIEFKDWRIDFDMQQSANDRYYFLQHKVLKGMDFSPPMIKKVNTAGSYFIVDESEMGNGPVVNQMPNETGANWKMLNTTELSPLYFFSQMGHPMSFLGEKKWQKKPAYGIRILPESSDQITVYLDPETFLLAGMEFRSYHPQLGWVDIKRTYLEYAEINGLKYPSKWTDKRGSTKLTYTIHSVELNPEIDQAIYEVEGQLNEEIAVSSDDVLGIIENYIEALDADCPFDESINQIKNGLINQYEAGKYETIENARVLATALSKDIIELTGDHHFGIDFNPNLFNALASENSSSEEDELLLNDEKSNGFFMDFEKRNDGIFYFKIDQMPRIKYAKPVVDSIMNAAVESEKLVIDLRNNTGGWGSFNQYLCSYFLPQNTLLYNQVTKKGTTGVYAEPVTHKLPVLLEIPIYILINENTVSAAEQLAYILQNHKRVTLIGQTTFGAAHGSIDVPLSNGLIGLIPIAYEKHISTERDWEGTGVVPEINTNETDLEKLIELIK